MYDGFRVEVEHITRLTDEQRQGLHKELAVLSVSTKGLFADPVQITDHHMAAHYTQELYAQETVRHLSRYLQQIGMEHVITVTLQPAQWERKKEQGDESLRQCGREDTSRSRNAGNDSRAHPRPVRNIESIKRGSKRKPSSTASSPPHSPLSL